MENSLDLDTRCEYCHKFIYHAASVVEEDGKSYCAPCYANGPWPIPPVAYEPHIQWREKRAVARAMAGLAMAYIEKSGASADEGTLKWK